MSKIQPLILLKQAAAFSLVSARVRMIPSPEKIEMSGRYNKSPGGELYWLIM